MEYYFKGILTENGWIENAMIETGRDGKILSIKKNKPPEKATGYALPGFQNAHSHAFQYAMAGLAELHEGKGKPDDFWSWRNAMYEIALTITPDQMEAIATMLYAEMLRHGYTSVAEFHYLHHDQNGKPYDNLVEMGERLVAAAETAGIRITLIPIFYQKGGFGKKPGKNQERFISKSADAYFRLYEETLQLTSRHEHASCAMGVHSLRAVDEDSIRKVCANIPDGVPFHIHVSEQTREVKECIAFYKKRPVEWLLDNCEINANYHLVHATHLTDHEVKRIAASGANVVLCPSTEGNLGDGLFRFKKFKKAGGRWSIGTDSHVGLNPMEELRLLDYGQRLHTHKRHTFYQDGQGDSGFNALSMVLKTGRRAMGNTSGKFFTPGDYLDAVVFDDRAPLLQATSFRNLCNSLVYTTDSHQIQATYASGQLRYASNTNPDYEKISKTFQDALKELGTRA